MEKTSVLIGNIYSGTHQVVQLQARSIKLEVYERVTNIIASGISSAFIILFGAVAFLFINLGLAFWLSEVYHSYKTGFFVLAAFYTGLLFLYLIFRHRIAKNSVRNSVLYKVSKDMNDYEQLLKEQGQLTLQMEAAESMLKENFDELKENIHTLKEDFDHIKETFGIHQAVEQPEKHVGPKLPRIAITSAIDFVLQHFIFKKAGFIKRTLLPIVANALITSTVFKENKKTSLAENLKLKLSKFL